MFTYSSDFKKHFKKLSSKIKNKVFERIEVFASNEFDITLNNHRLHGIYSEYRSINITGDLRVVYRKINNTDYLLVAIGTHSQLYK